MNAKYAVLLICLVVGCGPSQLEQLQAKHAAESKLLQDYKNKRTTITVTHDTNLVELERIYKQVFVDTGRAETREGKEMQQSIAGNREIREELLAQVEEQIKAQEAVVAALQVELDAAKPGAH